MTQSDISREVRSVALSLCDGYATVVSKNVRKHILEKDWDSLSMLEVKPENYASSDPLGAHLYKMDACVGSFLKKYEPLPTTFDRKKVALDNFLSSERVCYRTNQRLRPFIYGTHVPEDDDMLEFIQLCRKEMIGLIGLRPGVLEGRFGPGATYGDRGSLTTIPDKMQSQPLFTDEAFNQVSYLWCQTLWSAACLRRRDSVSFVRGNRFTTVPKNCKTNRGISIEPSGNLFYQLALGRSLRKALESRTCGHLVLGSMQEIHAQVAREASISGRFATIDLRQASDTVAHSLVELMCPSGWFTILSALRSPTTEVGKAGSKRTYLLEKFSSMGNGYTFELETVLFLAISCAVMRKMGVIPRPGINVFVYGDDIIVPTDATECLISALRYFGLTTNEDKTFTSGPFRESCGGDFFSGMDVRPYFLKEEPNEPQHFIAMANGIRAMGHENGQPNSHWPILIRTWFRILDFIPSDIRACRGPETLGDLVIHDEPSTWRTRDRGGRRELRCYSPSSHRKVKAGLFDPDVLIATGTYGVKLFEGFIYPRDSVTSHALTWVWYECTPN